MPITDITKKRCFWCNIKNSLYVAYHDNEWGVFPENEKKLYELFILETFQAGLSWECILNKRENFCRAYDGFDINKVCAYGEDKIEELMQDAGIIRNRAKLKASINNSCVYKNILTAPPDLSVRSSQIAKHSETLEPMVVYPALYGEYGIWGRPAST